MDTVQESIFRDSYKNKITVRRRTDGSKVLPTINITENNRFSISSNHVNMKFITLKGTGGEYVFSVDNANPIEIIAGQYQVDIVGNVNENLFCAISYE